jgi:hypothetical protein
MSIASLMTTSEKADTGEILDVFGPRIQFLTALWDNDQEYCLHAVGPVLSRYRPSDCRAGCAEAC